MATLRQAIIDLYDAKFKAITVANNYSSNLGNNVYEFRDPPLADEELPALSYGDTSDQTGDEDEGEHYLNLNVEITAFGTTSPAVMREMIQDVLTASKPTKSDGLVFVGAKYLGSEMFIEHDKKKYIKARIEIEINYETDLWEI